MKKKEDLEFEDLKSGMKRRKTKVFCTCALGVDKQFFGEHGEAVGSEAAADQ